LNWSLHFFYLREAGGIGHRCQWRTEILGINSGQQFPVHGTPRIDGLPIAQLPMAVYWAGSDLAQRRPSDSA
jgi:hypothetical protein